jgi:hypothetical protein
MPFKLAPEKWTGIAYIAPAIAVGGIWANLLFVASDTPGAGPTQMLRYALFENEDRHMFWWLAAIPLICLVLSAAYFSPIARGRRVAIALCGIGVVLAVATWLTMDWTIAVFATLPLLFSAPRAKWHLTNRWSGP